MSVEEAKNQPSNEPVPMIANHQPNTTGYDDDFSLSCSTTNLTGHYNTEDGAIRSVSKEVNPAYPTNPPAISITESPSIGGERSVKDTKNYDNTIYTTEPGSAESNAIYPANNGNPDWSTSVLKDKELNALYPRRVADSEESFPGKNCASTGDELEEGTDAADVGTEHITGCAIQPNLEAIYNNITETSVENDHYDADFTPSAPSSTNVLDLSSYSEEAKAKRDAGTRKLPNDKQAKRYQYPLANTTGTGERSQSDTVPTRGNTVYEIESRHDDIIDGTTLPSSNEKAIKQQNAETRKRLEVSFKQAKHALNPNTSRAGERSQFDTTNTGYESRRNNISDDDTIKPYAVVYNTEANPSESVRSNTGASHLGNPKAFSNPMYGADILQQATDGDRSDATDVQNPPNPPDTSGSKPAYRNAHKQADGHSASCYTVLRRCLIVVLVVSTFLVGLLAGITVGTLNIQSVIPTNGSDDDLGALTTTHPTDTITEPTDTITDPTDTTDPTVTITDPIDTTTDPTDTTTDPTDTTTDTTTDPTDTTTDPTDTTTDPTGTTTDPTGTTTDPTDTTADSTDTTTDPTDTTTDSTDTTTDPTDTTTDTTTDPTDTTTDPTDPTTDSTDTTTDPTDTTTDPTDTTTAVITSSTSDTTTLFIGTNGKAGKFTFDGKVGSDDFVLPYGLDISPGNEIFVTEQMKKQILIYNTKGIFLRSFSTGKYPWDVSADKDGNMWVVLGDKNDASLHKYSRNGQLLTWFNLPCREETGMYTSIALDTLSDNIIVTLMRTEDPPWWAWNGHKGISILNPGGQLVKRFGRRDLTYPNSVSVDKEGNIFVVDGKNFYVYKFDKNWNYRFKFGGEGIGEGKLKTPMGSCIDGSGRLLVADNRNNRVEMFSTDTGEHIRTVVKIFQPRFLAIGKRGELVVSNDDNIVTIFTKY
ncbi:hypothetical protein Bbelb_269450 [Branchiostoma belcheri]|nr:hypothetical protein Bbelb_269450 [Branchiostoma belcheri]